MDNEVEARRLTKKELSEQLDRIVIYNIDPSWDAWQIRRYYAGIESIRKWVSRITFTKRRYYHSSIDRIYKYIEETNGVVKKDELTLKEEEMERKYEEQRLEEKRKKEEENNRRKENRNGKRGKIFRSIADFFRRIKNGIVKKLSSNKGSLVLESGKKTIAKEPNEKEEALIGFRENLKIDADNNKTEKEDKIDLKEKMEEKKTDKNNGEER